MVQEYAVDGVNLVPLTLSDTLLPYCHEWFEGFFIECNIKLPAAFDTARCRIFRFESSI
jgi:hypothetical protein